MDDDANIVVNKLLKLWVFVRLVGPANSALDLTCTELLDEGADDLCLIDKVTIHKGSSFTKIMRNIVDNALENVTWTLDNSINAKILQVWIYEDIS